MRVPGQLADGKPVGDGHELAQGEVLPVHMDGLVALARGAGVLNLHDEETGPVSRPRSYQALRGWKYTMMVTVPVALAPVPVITTSIVSFRVGT